AAPAREVIPEIHHDHRDVTGGWLRPAVFGAMDGLVSNFALVAGVSGGGAATRVVVLTGFAGLVAGAFSMGTGEYTSVASQAEAAAAEIAVERAEILHAPEAEEAELAGVYRARGLDPALAREVARQLSADPETAVRVHAREELGIDPDDLPSPYVAAGSSFAAFSLGAFVPVLPYLLGARSLVWPLILSMLGLFLSGALVSRFTGRSAVYSGARQLVLGGIAAAITFVVGSLIGTGIS
ncbi:MAG: VIT1/CCC1 transporter family protein, partial [Mycobacteriales bacterium]